MGNKRFAGNAARNCAIGCTFSASAGRNPIITPSGTQITDEIAIRITTRNNVINPRTTT